MATTPVPGPTGHEARLLSIIQNAMDAIITVDASQRVVLFNAAAERVFGVPASEAIGSLLSRFIPERFRASHTGYVESFGHTQQTVRTMGHLGALSGLRANGTEFPIEASISCSVTGGERLYTVILRDVSERAHLQELLLQAQKMEGIGRLAGGIAHDFNNLLMAISNYLTLASNRLEPDHPARSPLQHVQEAANRAAMLTRQLLMFSRKQPARPRPLSPNEIIAGMEAMLRRIIGDDIVLRTALDERAGHVRADPTQLEQVIMNLVVNARDAMPQGGSLTIATANVHSEGQPNPQVAIVVTDTGMGMSPDVMRRLFEPFFTTKEVGKGTGLGLATCHGIVTQAGGQILAESAPGVGSTFRVLLPRLAEEPTGAQAAPSRPPPPTGTETLLLVEDSDVVRNLLLEALRQAGYTVLAAPDGRRALAAAREHTGPLHLLVSDIMMPGMSGHQLYETIAVDRGPIPVIFMSGGATPGGGGEILLKPFSTETLLRRIRAVLDAPRR